MHEVSKDITVCLDYPNLDRAMVGAMSLARMHLQTENNARLESVTREDDLLEEIKIIFVSAVMNISPVGTEILYSFAAILKERYRDDEGD